MQALKEHLRLNAGYIGTVLVMRTASYLGSRVEESSVNCKIIIIIFFFYRHRIIKSKFLQFLNQFCVKAQN